MGGESLANGGVPLTEGPLEPMTFLLEGLDPLRIGRRRPRGPTLSRSARLTQDRADSTLIADLLGLPGGSLIGPELLSELAHQPHWPTPSPMGCSDASAGSSTAVVIPWFHPHFHGMEE